MVIDDRLYNNIAVYNNLTRIETEVIQTKRDIERYMYQVWSDAYALTGLKCFPNERFGIIIIFIIVYGIGEN